MAHPNADPNAESQSGPISLDSQHAFLSMDTLNDSTQLELTY